ncbi:hypothetical protein CC86DRAFT_367729 [Ophiobolus disseminans]|uniref:Uncharacterized protein n=1 Tax=Ophiobolus disseminans TaxID=1469910 RepID=A0A6A7A938_9PLEO|nr:hypothetical protein CC86DRAFT_367729 [Ophiobolus disseminans]
MSPPTPHKQTFLQLSQVRYSKYVSFSPSLTDTPTSPVRPGAAMQSLYRNSCTRCPVEPFMPVSQYTHVSHTNLHSICKSRYTYTYTYLHIPHPSTQCYFSLPCLTHTHPPASVLPSDWTCRARHFMYVSSMQQG